MPKTGPQFRSTVVGTQIVRDLIEPLIRKAGGQRAAARDSRINQSQLSKMVRATGRYALSADVIRRLQQWLPPSSRAALEVALLREPEIRAITRYDNWMTGRSAELPPWRPGKRFALVAPLEAQKRRARRDRLLHSLTQTLPSLFGWFATQLAASRAKPDAARRAVAYDRVLEPFLEAEEVNGVEVGWEELTKSVKRGHGASPKGTKLWKVLEYGMRRELLLLDRAPDGTRCKSTAKAEFDKEMSLRVLERYLLREHIDERQG